jgi:hypothetical protein
MEPPILRKVDLLAMRQNLFLDGIVVGMDADKFSKKHLSGNAYGF